MRTYSDTSPDSGTVVEIKINGRLFYATKRTDGKWDMDDIKESCNYHTGSLADGILAAAFETTCYDELDT